MTVCRGLPTVNTTHLFRDECMITFCGIVISAPDCIFFAWSCRVVCIALSIFRMVDFFEWISSANLRFCCFVNVPLANQICLPVSKTYRFLGKVKVRRLGIMSLALSWCPQIYFPSSFVVFFSSLFWLSLSVFISRTRLALGCELIAGCC